MSPDPQRSGTAKTKGSVTTGEPLTVVHAPFDVGGNGYLLSRGERTLGVSSKAIVYFRQVFGYPVDRDLKVGAGRDPLRAWRWWPAIIRIALTADVVHFNFGTSFLSEVGRKRIAADLPLLHHLGIASFVTFQGCDSRISTFCLDSFATNACEDCRSRSFCNTTYNTYKREIIEASARYFDKSWALNPDLLHNIPHGEFLPYANVDLNAWVPPKEEPPAKGAAVRVLHAPTWRDIKGTPFILDALEELKAEGENIEIVLVENVPHDEVRTLYEKTDLLVDQVRVGWYGGLAVELMALGKPVVAYIRADDLAFLPDGMADELPVVSANPQSLKETLRALIRDPEGLRDRGRRSRAYVEKWHAPEAVAERTVSAYRDAVAERGGRTPLKRRLAVLTRLGSQRFMEIARLYASTWKVRLQVATRRLAPHMLSALVTLGWPMMKLRARYRLGFRKKPASLWGVTPILTLPLLARADRMLGFDTRSICYVTYHITDGFDIKLESRVSFLAKYAAFLLPVYYRLVFLWALHRFDVFHYFFDQGLLERDGRFGVSVEELRLLKRSGKRVYLYAYGADVRTRSETEALGPHNCCNNCVSPMVNCICDSAENAARMAIYQGHATGLVSMGDMMAYVPGAKNLWYWPIDIDLYADIGVDWDGARPLRVLHAPNHAWAKGSDLLSAAVKELQAEGRPIQLETVSGVSNERVMEMIAKCDVVADQFLIGWHGYTALEAMARGKLAMAYIRDEAMLLAPDECPLINVHPQHIADELRAILDARPPALHERGRRGRAYVETHYSIDAVSRRLATLYEETGDFEPTVAGTLARKR